MTGYFVQHLRRTDIFYDTYRYIMHVRVRVDAHDYIFRIVSYRSAATQHLPSA